jgi:LPS sulfotransferase NodH
VEQSDRLGAFPPSRVEEIQRRLGPIPPADKWPWLQGCLTVLFTARGGSTYLCRELETLFDIGRMGETLNPAELERRPAAKLVKKRRNRWFAFKAGQQGLVGAELSGFFDVYLDRTVFLLLARRDIVAQAVSLAKAEQSGVWHSFNEKRKDAEYDRKAIADAIRYITARFDRLQAYARRTGRPCRTLIYEDLANGDFSAVADACKAFGVPGHASDAEIHSRPVDRAGDDTNRAWIARFQDEMDNRVADLIEEYQTAVYVNLWGSRYRTSLLQALGGAGAGPEAPPTPEDIDFEGLSEVERAMWRWPHQGRLRGLSLKHRRSLNRRLEGELKAMSLEELAVTRRALRAAQEALSTEDAQKIARSLAVQAEARAARAQADAA